MTGRTTRQQRLKGELLQQRAQLMFQERREREIVRSSALAEMGPGLDEADLSEFDLQADLDLALLQLRSETLRHIDRALRRLDAGPPQTLGVFRAAGPPVQMNNGDVNG